MKNVAVIGAGLVGSLLSVYLAKRGLKVDVYERRPDMRKMKMSAGRSINLALSTRGWSALEKVGVAEKVKDISIPMKGRMIHNMDGTTVFQPYGKEGQAIYSVSRGELNKLLMDASEHHDNVNYHFNQKCLKVSLSKKHLIMQDMDDERIYDLNSDLIFGADGAFSMIRYSMQKTHLFNYQQQYLEHGYKELTIPPTADGKHKIDMNALHIWPRKSFMMIALPNLDGSFTCTLFAPFKGENSFEKVDTKEEVKAFFNHFFADAVPLMPEYVDEYFDNPTPGLVTIRCYPWVYENFALIGDASHAIVPFYGQGMNSGFEDCRVLDEIIDKHDGNWESILHEYQENRKPDADAIADLALQNFIEMRDLVADPQFLRRKKIEKEIADQYPDIFTPLYSMVTFSNTRYSEALRKGNEQKQLLDRIMEIKNLTLGSQNDEVKTLIDKWLAESSFAK